MSIDVSNQSELDKALSRTNDGRDELIVCMGDGAFTVGGSATVRARDSATVRAGGSATVEAWGSATVRARDSATVRAGGSATVEAWDSATVEAWGSATVRAGGSATVEAWGSATVRAWGSATVRAWDSATVEAGGSATVEAWESATVRAGGSATVRAGGSATVEAWGSATVRAWGSATVRAGDSATVEAAPHTPVIKSAIADQVTISGGVIVEIPVPKTAEEWCEFHQVDVAEVDGEKVATLYKALSPDLTAYGGFRYEIGEIPTAPDWDGGVRECGHGLHFSPSPFQAQEFRQGWDSRFIACPVRLSDIHVFPEGLYPQKVKAPGCCAPIYEVDIDGECVKEMSVAGEEKG